MPYWTLRSRSARRQTGTNQRLRPLKTGASQRCILLKTSKKVRAPFIIINKKKYIVVLSFFDDACQCFKTDLAALTGWL